MTNHMEEVAKLLGVTLGEEFVVKDENSNQKLLCQIDDKGLKVFVEEYGWNNYSYIELVSLLLGEKSIIKKPFVPKYHEAYWTFDDYGDPWYITNGKNNDKTELAMNIAFGNCFRTREEAEAHQEEIREKVKKVLRGEEEENEE